MTDPVPRIITSHATDPDTSKLVVKALNTDVYDIVTRNGGWQIARLHFRNAGVKDEEGLTNEILLAIVLDRLTRFQEGELMCAENVVALDLVQRALAFLHSRTTGRVRRGVEGDHTTMTDTPSIA